MMLAQQIFVFIVFIQLSSATISVPVYFNAQFFPVYTGLNLADLFFIDSPTKCACECMSNSRCLTATYFGINQTCSLFSVQLNTKFLQVVTTNMDARVFDFGKRTISATTIDATTTTSVTTSTSTTTSVTTSTSTTTSVTTSTSTTTSVTTSTSTTTSVTTSTSTTTSVTTSTSTTTSVTTSTSTTTSVTKSTSTTTSVTKSISTTTSVTTSTSTTTSVTTSTSTTTSVTTSTSTTTSVTTSTSTTTSVTTSTSTTTSVTTSTSTTTSVTKSTSTTTSVTKSISTTTATSTTGTSTTNSCTSYGSANLLSVSNALPWIFYTFIYIATNPAPVLSFVVNGSPAGETAYLDDVSVVDTMSPLIQLLRNPSFANSTSTVTGWTIWCTSSCKSTGDGGQIATSGCHTGSGNNCYTDHCNGGYDFLGQSFSAIVGHIYTISFWLYKTGGGAGNFYANIS